MDTNNNTNEREQLEQAVNIIAAVGQKVLEVTGSIAHDFTDPVVMRIMSIGKDK